MTETTQTDVPSTNTAQAANTAPRPRQRRMARVSKPSDAAPGDKVAPEAQARAATEPKAPRQPSKIASVIALLERPEGATLAEMVEATGWLPHTTRAALTGLKKKGHTLNKDKRDDVTCYRIVKAG